MGNLEMAEFEDLSEPGRRSVEAALRGARRIEAVIDDLLTVARFSDPHATFDAVHVDLREVVRDVAEECGHAAAASEIAYRSLPDEPVQCLVAPTSCTGRWPT